ncbi:type II secretion system protein GspL [Gilvimarinus sp. SDUM040013]|uniref:Type II secretion system protein L n=1 Tax=Gilvimarinus gilvus TaxID=3058038 RepID=A0ABU4S1B8_9GAMM|nr:type II secretion system protein GspL [Gilvimarinus sp. SDUM040013]MDO3388728.1 type II secretion system protein GspL [Gilvimarinus sp. SDUM040013]MDX6849623.1 type II secretion system protein GspL [Gilvimarinus sp. SDUM040013]
MSESLTLYISHYGSNLTWLFRRPDLPDELGQGDIDTLANALEQGNNHQARLIVGGPQTVSRTVQYTEGEKRHLRKLMPFQLEEDVIGDIDQFHFAFGVPANGSVSLVYTERAPLQEIFTALAAINVEVIQVIPAALLPTTSNDNEEETADENDSWAIHWQDGLVSVRCGASSGFTIAASSMALALELLLKSQSRVSAPKLVLSAPDETQLEQLEQRLPAALSDASGDTRICSLWDFEPDAGAIDLCQGEFSQRLPVERWWNNWRKVAFTAIAAVVVYLATLLYSIHQLQNDNLEIRREIEQVFRTVVPNGPAIDPERRLRIMARDLQPSASGSAVMALLDQVLPAIQSAEVTLKGVYYTSDNGELSLNLQAGTFNAIESLRGSIESIGLSAELLSASAQGDTHSARMKIKQELP